MKLEKIYEMIREASDDAEVQRLEAMLDRVIGAIYTAQEALEAREDRIIAAIYAAQDALEESERCALEESEHFDREIALLRK